MATTPPTSISSSYQRLGGSTPVITQTAPGPQLSGATQERLRLAEERKLEDERRAAELRRLSKLTPYQLSEEMKKRARADIEKNKESFRLKQSETNPFSHFGTGPQYSYKPGEISSRI